MTQWRFYLYTRLVQFFQLRRQQSQYHIQNRHTTNTCELAHSIALSNRFIHIFRQFLFFYLQFGYEIASGNAYVQFTGVKCCHLYVVPNRNLLDAVNN